MPVTINGDGLIEVGGTSTTQGRVRLAEDTDTGTNYIELTAPSSVTANRTITFPDNTGTVALTSDVSSFPAGTAMLFVQTAAPTGWTKSTTHNDKALRIVSGAASSGGTTAFSTVFAAGRTSDATTLTTAQMPSHTHTTPTGFSGGGTAYWAGNCPGTGLSSTSGATGGGGSHTHGLPTFAVQYVDVIIATKD